MNHPYAEFIHRVDKPARYLGGEYQSQKKDWDAVETRFCLAFPDVYDIGMSHLGTKILYSLLNKIPGIACERAFAPWPDMEKELRERRLPILSLESARPLSDFDAIGCSLQYELTYSNVLTLLDLGGIPLRALDRRETDPIVWAGGPTATHPEPIAPFFDCILIGEAEEALPMLLLFDAANKKAGLSRNERLARLAEKNGVYVPQLYSTVLDPGSKRLVVDKALDARAPLPIERFLVEDLNKFPFPDDTPVAWAEAVFDRVSVEIARGCTEGCRFCQAGMIYRPVRERNPDAIVDSLVGAIKKGGYDEASLTSLSTADFSCITPLVKRVTKKLRDEKVSLSVSSLRAYGLNGDLLDEIASVRASGLTFAPEAGTQRMRDVINKNVTEEDISRSAENVFSRGFARMKLYFMIGLPTETDEDVRGIAQTGARLKRLGKRIRKDAEVMVSVSSHVPKPHTPFQWCQMDSMPEIIRKQRILRDVARNERVDVKWHEAKVSWVEGLFSRGDRRLADVLETAWRSGARFDGWEEHIRFDIWEAAFAAHGIDVEEQLAEIPLSARLPWDHIDIGLEDGFLAREWEKATKNRAAPPCGKPNGDLLHHSNIEDALADERKLVCYDCGVACDMTHMKEERVVYLRVLGAHKEPDKAPLVEMKHTTEPRPEPMERKYMHPKPSFEQGEGTRWRIRYTKLGRAAFISHLDTARLLQRLFRRAEIGVIYSRGFHPKPEMTFGPALALGIAALGELFDVRIENDIEADVLLSRLRSAAPDGIRIERVARLAKADSGISKVIATADYAALLPSEMASKIDFSQPLPNVIRTHKGDRPIEVAKYVVWARPASEEEAARLRVTLEWPAGDNALVLYRVLIQGDGGVKPGEVIQSLLKTGGIEGMPQSVRHARLALLGSDETGAVDAFSRVRMGQEVAQVPVSQ